MLRVQSFVVIFHFTHDVLIGSFSDMIFYLSMWHFSRECALHILCWCVLCFRYETSFHLYILITLAWPIMEDIEPIDLGLGDQSREFETVTHFTFWSEQYHIHIYTLTLWTWWLTHLGLTWHHLLVPLHDFTTLVCLSMLQYHCLSFPSFPWSD